MDVAGGGSSRRNRLRSSRHRYSPPDVVASYHLKWRRAPIQRSRSGSNARRASMRRLRLSCRRLRESAQEKLSLNAACHTRASIAKSLLLPNAEKTESERLNRRRKQAHRFHSCRASIFEASFRRTATRRGLLDRANDRNLTLALEPRGGGGSNLSEDTSVRALVRGDGRLPFSRADDDRGHTSRCVRTRRQLRRSLRAARRNERRRRAGRSS